MSRLQSVEPLAELRHQLGQDQDQRGDLRGSPWLTSAEACAYLRFTGKHRLRSLYAFLADQGVPTCRRGRTLLIARRDLDRAIGARAGSR